MRPSKARNPAIEPRVIPRMALELGPESSVLSLVGGRVTAVVEAAAVEELDDVDVKMVDVDVAEEVVEVAERTFCSLLKNEVAFIQLFFVVSNNAMGLAALPPENTSVPLGPCAMA
jgi:hypothetical protein